MPFLEYHGASLHYEFYSSESTAPPLVLVHGFLENLHMWKELLPQWTAFGSVLTIDLPGHGATSSFGYEHSMEFMADAVYAITTHLNLQPFLLLGHSMGGYVGLEFATLYPEQLVGLGLFFSTPEPDSVERKLVRERAVELVKQNKNTFVRASIPQLFDAKTRETIKSDIEALIARTLQMETQGIVAAIYGMKKRVDRSLILHQPPTHLKERGIAVFAGRQDTVIPFDQVQQWWEAPGVTFQYESPYGHMGHMSDRDGCVAAVLQWWKSLTPGGAA
ncbi:MAG: Haloacetate dehalogenase H-1 [Flavobacteriales bacterium UBA4585]|nr:MAG: Haloacetate dehalogenase H-1 [Flavobacteriales bacterium UBA4585]